MTQPRALFKPEERDNVLADINEEVREMHRKLEIISTVLLGVDNTSDGGLCSRVARNEDKLDRYQTTANRDKVGLGIGIILALLAALLG